MHDHQSEPQSRQITIPGGFAAAVADPARPLVTWYDDGTGERTELSGATCANWVAKTANLVADGCGLGAGDEALVDAPPHWQTAAILLGCWSAGLRVATAPGHSGGVDVVFAAAGRAAGYVEQSGDVFGLALAPLAAPLPSAPPGVADFVVEVRGHGDHFTPAVPVGPEDPATLPPPGLTHRELCARAADRASALGIPAGAGARVLVDVSAYPDPLDWLLAPLLAGASTVLCQHLDPAALPGRVATERVTVTLTAPTPGRG